MESTMIVDTNWEPFEPFYVYMVRGYPYIIVHELKW